MTYADRNDLIATMRRHRICVLVPTYNNAGTLRDVLSGVLEYAADVIVVNDGSTDSTREILESFGDAVTVVDYTDNQGKGTALKRGFRKALELGYEYAITIDSDGQHYPEDLPAFVRAVAENEGSLIVGERDLSNVDINGKSSFANKFSNFWFHVQTGIPLRDTQTGYRAYPLRRLRGLSLLTSRYEAELELLVFSAWHGVDIVSIPIRVYYPPQSERVSHFRPGLDFTRISILNTFLCVAAIVYGLPLGVWNAFSRKRLFRREFRPFTRRRSTGEKKDAATTLGRFFRSVYGFSFFIGWSAGIFTPLTCISFAFGKPTERKKMRLHKTIQWFARTLIRAFPGAVTEYENETGEDFSSPALIICNHQSHLDLPVLMALHPKMIFVTNARVWNNPVYGKVIHNADYLPVTEGVEGLLERMRDLKKRGYSIVIFPEGTRSADCSILRFHQGAFLAARELGYDIMPMVLHGAGHFLPKKDTMFRRCDITLRILPRVKAGTHDDLPLRKEASLYRKLIREQYDDIAYRRENARYFRGLVLYKYAYRGWAVTSRCKRTLSESARFDSLINTRGQYRRVRIINSGIGTFALLYALVNRDTEVDAFESRLADFETAQTTAALPSNLHYTHAVWESEFGAGADYDLTIVLGRGDRQGRQGDTLYIPIES